MIKVAEIQPQQWQDVMDFAKEKCLATPDELAALEIACQLPTNVPNSFQSKKLLALLEKLYEEGFCL